MTKKFQGSMVAIVTPFVGGKVDEKTLRMLIERQIAEGTSGIIPCGTTGESPTLTHEEHDRVIEITVDQVRGRVKVLAGAGSNATHEAIRLHRAAFDAGADGALHITGYYNKPNQEGLYQHFKAVSESTSLPIILYNAPGRTVVNILPETVARLAELKNIVGIKEASGSLDQIATVISLCPKAFEVISGDDPLNMDIYKLGGCGTISVTANVAPRLSAEVWELFANGQETQAQSLEESLMQLHKDLFIDTNPIPVKAALAMMGLVQEEYRLPLTPLAGEKKQQLRATLKKYQLV